MYPGLLARLRGAQPTQLHIKFSEALPPVPEQLTSMAGLQMLSMEGPDRAARLSHDVLGPGEVQQLHSSTQCVDAYLVVGQLRRLVSLDLRSPYPPKLYLPSAISHLVALKALRLSDVKLAGDVASLSKLTRLKLINFNQVSLDERSCRDALSSALGSLCSLTFLKLLKSPQLHAPPLGMLTGLCDLRLVDMGLHTLSLPPLSCLTQVSLAGNQLQTAPLGLTALTQLRQLNLSLQRGSGASSFQLDNTIRLVLQLPCLQKVQCYQRRYHHWSAASRQVDEQGIAWASEGRCFMGTVGPSTSTTSAQGV